jgi:hypothetical protein
MATIETDLKEILEKTNGHLEKIGDRLGRLETCL